MTLRKALTPIAALILVLTACVLPSASYADTIYSPGPIDIGTVGSMTNVQACVPVYIQTQAPGGPIAIPCQTLNLVAADFPNGVPGNFEVITAYQGSNNSGKVDVNLVFTGAFAPGALMGLRYQILGVDYAPPGTKSTVDYGNSQMLGTSTSNTRTFVAGTSVTVSSVGNFFVGGSTELSYSQEQDGTSSITLADTTTGDEIIPGPTVDGVDHDYDVIWVWLNPVVQFQVTSLTGIAWTGYTYSTNQNPLSGLNTDPLNNIDVVPLTLYQLKNPSTIATDNPGLAYLLARTWDTSGAGGLGDGDYQIIMQADPFWQGHYDTTSNQWIDTYNPATDPNNRFTVVPGGSVQYFKASPGDNPITQQYMQSESETSSQNQTAKYTYSVQQTSNVTWDWVKLSTQATYTVTDTSSQTINNGTTHSAKFAITGPASTDTYNGPNEFALYRDNIYGSFMFYYPPFTTSSILPAISLILQSH